MIDKYLNKSYTTCGTNHYWPSDYPLVESKHRLYTLICQSKKKIDQDCKLSFECIDHEAVCVRFMFKKVGTCVRIYNKEMNNVKNDINDAMFKIGKTVKDTWKFSINKVKEIFG
jgi:hypothetical protein